MEKQKSTLLFLCDDSLQMLAHVMGSEFVLFEELRVPIVAISKVVV